MSIKDCIQLVKDCDPEDAAAIRAQQQELVASGVPGADAWTQAAELVMEQVLGERNELAAEIREKGGYLEDLEIENLLNPRSYLQAAGEEGAAMVRQATLGANQRKGTMSILKKEHPDAYEAAQRMLRRMPKKDAAMVRRNLKEHEGTGWAASAVKSLVIRDSFEGLMTGRDVDAMMNSEFWGNDPLSRYTMVKWLRKGPEGARHLAKGYHFIGTNRKAENDVSGSFLNCEPSKECAKHCYAVSANGRTVELMKSEFTELAARMFPDIVAKNIASRYRHSPAGIADLSLRINDKGDLSDAQVDVIKRINDEGVALQVFSKRPELLRQLSDLNLKMLSIDESNIDVATANPDLNLAVTLTDNFTEEMVAQVNDRVAVYLPVNLRGKAWSTEVLKGKYPNQFQNMKNMMCPVEAGKVTTKKGMSFVDIKENLADGNWTCTACDLLGAVGCFHKDRKTDNRKAAMGLFEIEVNEAQNTADLAVDHISRELNKLQEAGAIDVQSAIAILGDVRQAVRIPQPSNVPDPEAAGVEGVSPGDEGDTGRGEEDGGVARRAAPEAQPEESLKSHRRKVSGWLKKPLKRLSNKVPVRVVNNENDVPFEVPPMSAGYKYRGKVYLFRDYIRNEDEAIEAITHESIGHLGIEGVLGRKKFNELIGDVANIMVEIKLDKSGKLHPKVRAIQAQLREFYVDENGDYMLNPRQEAREIIAHIADRKPRLGRLREIYNKIVAWVRQWAADHGMGDPDMAKIESLLVEATAYVTDPDMQIQEDIEQGAAIRRVRPPNRPPVPPDPEQMTQTERDKYDKLGLNEQEVTSIWKALSNLRWTPIKKAMKEANARGYEGLFDGLIEVKRKELEAGVGLGKEITYLGRDNNGNYTVQKRTVDHAGSAYVGMRLATGVSDMMTHILHWGALQWEGGVLTPIEGTRGFLDMMRDLGPDNLNDWLLWMGSHRADLLDRQGREKNLTRAEIDEGMAVAGPVGSERHQLFTRIKNEYAALNRFQLDVAEGAGLIDPAKRAEWDTEWYVPFYRQTEDEVVLGPNTKRGFSHQSAGIRRLKGGKVPTADLMQNILQNWIRLTDASVKNHALKTMMDNFQGTDYISDATMEFRKALVPETELHKYIKEHPDFAKRLAEWLDVSGDSIAGRFRGPGKVTADAIVDALSELSNDQLQQIWQVVAPTAPDVVRVQRDGKNEYYRIHVPGLLRATGHMQPRDWQSSAGMRAGRWFKQLLTVGVTASPDFMMRNFIRDAAHSWAINKDNMWFLKDSLAGLKEAAAEGPIHRAMMASGASFQGGYVHGTDPEATKNIMRRELKRAGMNAATVEKYIGSIHFTNGQLERTAGKWWQTYRDAGDRIENASRVATAEAGRKAGKPMAQWLFESKDLMDYSRRGNFAALIMLTDLMPFLNARVQGLDKLNRAIASDPKIVGKKIAMIAAFSIFLAYLNDEEDDYQELPDWEKDAYWHVYFDPGTGKEHIRIPKPFELGFVAGTMPERMYRSWYTKSQPSEKVLWAFHHGIRETLNINVYPQFILPVAEMKANRHFYFDQPIESLADKNVIPKERYNQYTSETAILMAEGLDNPLTDWMEMSPKQLQHLWNGYTGTLGAYALSFADRIAGPAAGFPKPEEIQLEDMPLIKSLYKGQRKRTTQWQVDFYDRLKEVNELYGTLQKYRKQGNLEKFQKFREENKEKLKLRRMMTRQQKNFSTLRKRREAVLRNDDLTPEQKYQQSQAIQVQINELAKKIEAATREGF